MMSFRQFYLTEMYGSYQQGFIAPDGTDLAGDGAREDHAAQAAKMGTTITNLLYKGYIRYWLAQGEIDLNFVANKPVAATNAVRLLSQVYQPGDNISLDIVGAVLGPSTGGHSMYTQLGPAKQWIRQAGGLTTAAPTLVAA
jgi:hypothetical protein